jgi:hypothetical protein
LKVPFFFNGMTWLKPARVKNATEEIFLKFSLEYLGEFGSHLKKRLRVNQGPGRFNDKSREAILNKRSIIAVLKISCRST